MSFKASVKAFSSGGGEVSVGDVAWLGSRGVSATDFDGVSGFGEETGLGCSVASAALAGGGEAGGGSGGSTGAPAASPSVFLGSGAPARSGAVASCLGGDSAAGVGGSTGGGAVGGTVDGGVRRARASRTLAKMKPTSMPHGA